LTDTFILACGIFGLAAGSFANVCVHRLPGRASVISPGSHCPVCRKAIAWYDNIPVLSYMLLRGSCRHCGTSISIRYPLLEAGMAASWAYLAWQFGLSPQLLMALTLISLLWVLSLIDLETGLLPDVITLPGIALGLIFSLWTGSPLDSLIGAVAGYAVFWLVARGFLLITGREGLGYGDFKLLAMLGAFLGWQALPFIVFIASATGAIVGGLFLTASGRHARTPIPFGPFLAAAGAVWLSGREPLLHLFMNMAQA